MNVVAQPESEGAQISLHRAEDNGFFSRIATLSLPEARRLLARLTSALHIVGPHSEPHNQSDGEPHNQSDGEPHNQSDGLSGVYPGRFNGAFADTVRKYHEKCDEVNTLKAELTEKNRELTARLATAQFELKVCRQDNEERSQTVQRLRNEIASLRVELAEAQRPRVILGESTFLMLDTRVINWIGRAEAEAAAVQLREAREMVATKTAMISSLLDTLANMAKSR